ncbi:uncharacterized protein LOC124338539 [Daphnia pulicaria]|uniref:uncharacterized protein LOC124338539 n=1 Tax=Daphnia pulicaria TaxID=35523 RepID=UPI001EEB1C4C|nr:uncharacterized protein LOC124338539 [Daphnia pulicaria]
MLQKTLFEFCVDSIIEEMEREWGQKSSKVSDVVNPEVSSNPFEHLPTEILEEVIRILRKKKLLKKYLRWIILPQLHSLDLSLEGCKDRNKPVEKQMFEHLKCASVKCSMLKNLNLTYNVLNEENFIGLLPTFKNLQVLDLAITSAGDNCLWALGTHCKYLRFLHLQFCREVTDFGIKGLCLDYIEKEDDEDKRISKASELEWQENCAPPRLSNSLEILYLEGTRVTEKGIQEALQKLRSLKVLGYHDTAYVLGEMHREDWENPEKRNKIPKYALTKILFYISNQTSIDRLQRVVSQCPLITNLCMKGWDILENAKFDGIMIPIFNMIGNSLEEFSLNFVINFNLCTIIDCCPNLRKLTLNYGGWNTEPNVENKKFSNIQERKTLGKLQELTLISVKISTDNLITLMSSSSLKSIVLIHCQTFNDDILQQAYDQHSFPNLEYFELNYCPVTERGINFLLNEKTPLKKIKIIESWQKYTKEILEDWNLQMVLKNRQLDIEFLVIPF